MEIKYLAFIVGWYGLLALLFFAVPTQYTNGAGTTGGDFFQVNASSTPNSEIDQNSGFLGFFNSIFQMFKMISRMFLFCALGIGLPSDTPSVISAIFSVVVIFINLVVIFTIKNAFYKG